jgi:hypothetical protein
VLPQYGNGTACPVLNETQTCNTDPCPIDCVLTEFEIVSGCSAPCGGGFNVSRANVSVPAQYGGHACGNQFLAQSCNTQACENPEFFQNCTFECNGVVFFNITTLSFNASNFTDTNCSVTCLPIPPIDCELSDWILYQVGADP